MHIMLLLKVSLLISISGLCNDVSNHMCVSYTVYSDTVHNLHSSYCVKKLVLIILGKINMEDTRFK